MNLPRSAIVSLLSGAIYSTAWWIFVDAFGQSKIRDDFPAFNFYMAVPGLIMTIALFMINIVDFQKVQMDDSYDNTACKARTFLLIAILIAFGALIGSLWIMIDRFINADTTTSITPGVIIFISNLLIFISALLWKVGRSFGSSSSF